MYRPQMPNTGCLCCGDKDDRSSIFKDVVFCAYHGQMIIDAFWHEACLNNASSKAKNLTNDFYARNFHKDSVCSICLDMVCE